MLLTTHHQHSSRPQRRFPITRKLQGGCLLTSLWISCTRFSIPVGFKQQFEVSADVPLDSNSNQWHSKLSSHSSTTWWRSMGHKNWIPPFFRMPIPPFESRLNHYPRYTQQHLSKKHAVWQKLKKLNKRRFETYWYYSVEFYIVVVAPPRKLHEVPHGLWGVLVIELYCYRPNGCL
jgi:hypothetical protein